MKGTHRISIAMATCEGQRFVDAQLESIAGQSLLPSELVVCDDASTDETASRVRAFADRVAFPVRLIVNPQRLGITLNFEQALRETSGDLIFFADQDDLWRPEKIQTHVAAFERNARLGMTFSNADVVGADGHPLGYDLWSSLFFDPREQHSVGSGQAAEIFMRRVIAAGTTLAFRAEYKPLLLPFPDLYSVHDAWVAFMLACVSECAILPAPLIDYRLHDANQVGIRRFSLPAQLAQARRQISEHAFAQSAAFFEAARQRFEQVDRADHQASAARMALIDAKISHMLARDTMSDRFLERLPVILREIVRGHYGQFGYGLKSVAQDLFLR